MGRQRNNPQTREKEDSPEKKLNKVEGSNVSDMKFKVMIISMLKEIRTLGGT